MIDVEEQAQLPRLLETPRMKHNLFEEELNYNI